MSTLSQAAPSQAFNADQPQMFNDAAATRPLHAPRCCDGFAFSGDDALGSDGATVDKDVPADAIGVYVNNKNGSTAILVISGPGSVAGGEAASFNDHDGRQVDAGEDAELPVYPGGVVRFKRVDSPVNNAAFVG